MPPTLCGGSLGFRALRQSHPAISTTTRTFSCTFNRSKIGPESPKFIEIPQPPQRYAIPLRNIKGTLPVPRNIFPRCAGDKTSSEYLAQTTPKPTTDHRLSEPKTEYTAWKRRMAASRRQNLRDGLIQLHQRKVRTDKAIALRSTIKQRKRSRSVNAPQREDERLTSPTITAATRKLVSGTLPDPNREARLAAAAARVQAKTADLEERRRNELHTLYMHARDFITTEAQLDEKVEEIFTDQPFKHVVDHAYEVNIWDAEGPPTSIQSMLSEVNNTQRLAINYHKSPAMVTGKRMKEIAEELTGGKMD